MRAIDICAGAGGLSLGLQVAGFDVLGVEHDADAVETHRANVGPCELADITTWHPSAPAALVAGGVPCQSFSAAGDREGTNDPRGVLYRHLIRIAVEADAEAILLENVRGMLSWRDYDGSGILPRIEAEMRAAGYEPTHTVLCAANYGVPQNRYRLFIVAFRSEAARLAFRWPSPTHDAPGGLLGLKPWVTVREALGLGGGAFVAGKPERYAGGGGQGMRSLDVDAPAPSVVGGWNQEKLSPLDSPAHSVTASAGRQQAQPSRPGARRLGELAVAIGVLDRPSCTITTVYDESGDPKKPSRRPQVTLGAAVASVLDRPGPTISAGGTGGGGGAEPIANREIREALSDALATAGLADRPATTIASKASVAVAGHHVVHQAGAVRLTAEQCAALQDMAGFVFAGGKGSQHKQIGNAVPPALGEAVGRSIMAALLAAQAREVA